MRNRHPGAFPFRWYAAGALTNAATIEPVTWTLLEGVEVWWRLQRIQLAITMNFTIPSVGTGNLVNTFEGWRYRTQDTGHTELVSGDELQLNHPGQKQVWNCEESASFYGTEGTFLDPLGGSFQEQWICRTHFFTDSVISGATVKRRGTWPSGDNITLKPAVDAGFVMGMAAGGSDSCSVLVTNIALGGGYDSTGTFTGTIFGQSASFNYGTQDGDYTGFVVNSITLAITKKAWFAYSNADTGTVWNTATGAQILNPRTASVP